VVVASVADLRDSLHDRTLRDRLSSALGVVGDVLLYVDRGTSYEVLSALVGVLGVAGVRQDHLELAVAGPDGRTASVRLGPPRPPVCELTSSFSLLTVPPSGASSTWTVVRFRAGS